MSETQDLTLDEIRALLAPILPRHAAFDGWRPQAVAMAAQEKGVDADVAQLAFTDGAIGMIDAWFASIDARMMDALPPDRLATLSIGKRCAGRWPCWRSLPMSCARGSSAGARPTSCGARPATRPRTSTIIANA